MKKNHPIEQKLVNVCIGMKHKIVGGPRQMHMRRRRGQTTPRGRRTRSNKLFPESDLRSICFGNSTVNNTCSSSSVQKQLTLPCFPLCFAQNVQMQKSIQVYSLLFLSYTQELTVQLREVEALNSVHLSFEIKLHRISNKTNLQQLNKNFPPLYSRIKSAFQLKRVQATIKASDSVRQCRY